MFLKKEEIAKDYVIAPTQVKTEPRYMDTIEVPQTDQSRKWIILDFHTNKWIEKCKICKNYEGDYLNGEDGQYFFICKENVAPLPLSCNYFCR